MPGGRSERGLELARDAAAAVPTDSFLEPLEVAQAKLLLGMCLWVNEWDDEARETLQEALDVALAFGGDDHPVAVGAKKYLDGLPPLDH